MSEASPPGAKRAVDEFIVRLPVSHDDRGRLSVVEGGQTIPFGIRRVYYLYDVPSGERRAGHAHRALRQVLIAVSGSFEVILDDGASRTSVVLNRPWEGLLIESFIWREIENFSAGAVCLVLASEHFDEGDYIRDYASFLDEARERRR